MVCVRDETQIMPDYNTHGFAYISPAMYNETAGFDYYPQINVISSLSKKEFADKADEALDTTLMILTKDETVSYAGPQGEIEEGKTMGSILPVLFLLIAVLTMVTTIHRVAAKEKTQISQRLLITLWYWATICFEEKFMICKSIVQTVFI